MISCNQLLGLTDDVGLILSISSILRLSECKLSTKVKLLTEFFTLTRCSITFQKNFFPAIKCINHNSHSAHPLGQPWGICSCCQSWGIHRPANSHGSAVSLAIFCHFSRFPVKALNLTVFFLGKIFLKGSKLSC